MNSAETFQKFICVVNTLCLFQIGSLIVSEDPSDETRFELYQGRSSALTLQVRLLVKVSLSILILFVIRCIKKY